MNPSLDIIASGSSGNAYVITAGHERLMIECGVPFKEVLHAIPWGGRISDTKGCLVTHRHADHFGYHEKVQTYNIPIYSLPSIADDFEGVFPLLPIHKYKIGGFKVMPIHVQHGNCENYSYIIDNPFIGRIVFATDCEDFPYDIKDVTTLMIEANYSEDILLQHALDGEDIRSRSETHMEINRTLACVERLQSPKLRRVVLLHLSDGLSDEKAFIKAVQEKVGEFVDVYAADKGMTLSLEKDYF